MPTRTYTAYMGAYSSGTTYNPNEIVLSGGTCWISLVANNTGNAPATSPSYWSLFGGAQQPTENRVFGVVPLKGITLPSGTSYTIFSKTGAGSVERIQLAFTYNNGSPTVANIAALTTITIVVDGNTFTCPLGMFLLWYGYSTSDGASGASQTDDLFLTKYLGITNATSVSNETIGGYRRIYIPYSSSITISLNSPSSATSTMYFYSQVEFYPGAPPAGLHPPTRNKFHMVTNDWATSSFSLNEYLTILGTVSGPGELESIYFMSSAPGSVQPNWLEAPPTITVDGTTFEYGGTEDFFGNQFYGSQIPLRADEYGIARSFSSGSPDSTTYWSGYRYFRESPMPFQSSVAMSWQNSPGGGTSATRVGSAAVYYTAS